MRWLIALLVLGAACSATVDTSNLDPVGDYTSWSRLDTTGKVPAHKDTYRITYTNTIAQRFSGAGEHAVGSVYIKEVRALTAEGTAGELDYIAIMRKLDPDDPPDGIALEKGWLFTLVADATDIGSSEKTGDCWQGCHIQAPYDGAWIYHGW